MQCDGRQLKNPRFRANLCEFFVGQRFEHPGHPQRLGKGVQVSRMGEPGKAFDLGFCCFAGVGQRCDQTALEPRKFTFAHWHGGLLWR
ncbi:hypothetical protein D9M68_993040 [compost metagenome]